MRVTLSIVLLFLTLIASTYSNPNYKCLNSLDFKTKITRRDELIGDWEMAHFRPIDSEGFLCPGPKLRVTPVSTKDINYWKTKCLHKLDISILDETKFELKVIFPEDFEVPFTIILREIHGDHILFPSCIFEKVDFVKEGDRKMWIATREEDGLRLPVAVSVPSWEESRCILQNERFYHFC